MNSLANFLVDRRRWLAFFSLLIVVFSSSGLGRLSFQNDYRMFFSKDNPELRAFEALQDRFSRTDNLLITVSAREGDLFKPEHLAALASLTREAWRLPTVRRVDSPANFQHSEAIGDDLAVGSVIARDNKLSPVEITRIREILTKEPMLVGRLLSPNGTVAGIFVSLTLSDLNKDTEVLEVAKAARALKATAEANYPGLQLHLTGSAMMDTAFHDASEADGKTLIPMMIAVVMLLSWWLLGSLMVMGVITCIIGFSILISLGLAGHFGISLSPTSVSAPNIIMTLAVADAVHFISSWQRQLFALKQSGGGRREAAMILSLEKNIPPVIFTTVATIISFLTMNFSDAPPFRDLGNITAMGVTATFLLSLFLLPTLVLMIPERWVGRPRDFLPGMLTRLFNFIRKSPRKIAVIGTLSSLALMPFIFCNALNDEYVKYFDTSLEFRQETDWVERHLTGIYTLEYALPSEGPDGVFDPDYLLVADRFSAWLRTQPGVTHVFSIVDVLKKLNRNMNGEDPAYYKVPKRRDLAMQYFFAYEMSLPPGVDLTDRVDISRESMLMTVSLANISSEEVLHLHENAEAWLQVNAPSKMRVSATGPSIMFANIGARNIREMIRGELLGLVLVVILLAMALRSLKLGALAMVSTILPTGVVFALWGLTVGQVGLAASVVAAMTLGILADDTVHFLGRYKEALKQNGGSKENAVHHAFMEAGTALWTTSIVLVGGFVVLSTSHFRINSELGLLTTLILVLGIVADFVLLPAILLSGDQK